MGNALPVDACGAEESAERRRGDFPALTAEVLAAYDASLAKGEAEHEDSFHTLLPDGLEESFHTLPPDWASMVPDKTSFHTVPLVDSFAYSQAGLDTSFKKLPTKDSFAEAARRGLKPRPKDKALSKTPGPGGATSKLDLPDCIRPQAGRALPPVPELGPTPTPARGGPGVRHQHRALSVEAPALRGLPLAQSLQPRASPPLGVPLQVRGSCALPRQAHPFGGPVPPHRGISDPGWWVPQACGEWAVA